MLLVILSLTLLGSFSNAENGGCSNGECPSLLDSNSDVDAQEVSDLLPEIDGLDSSTAKAEGPFVIAPQEVPSNRGRSDIEIDDEVPFKGYVYPKPSKPFNLPPFKTLDAQLTLGEAASFAEDDAVALRSPRSPQRPFTFHPRPPALWGGRPSNLLPHARPNYQPNWGNPGIRPLPALYGRR